MADRKRLFEQVSAELARKRVRWLSDTFPEGVKVGANFCIGDETGAPGKSLKIPLNPPPPGMLRGRRLKDFAGTWRGDDLALFTSGSGFGMDMLKGAEKACRDYGLSVDLSPLNGSQEPPRRPVPTGPIAPIGTPALRLIKSNGSDRTDGSIQPDLTSGNGRWQHIENYLYRDRHGVDCVTVERWLKPDGEKTFRQYIHATGLHTGQQERGVLPDPLPLYRLDELVQLPQDQNILIVAGEKCAEAARRIGIFATTNLLGEKALASTDWSPFKDRVATIWPDNDDTGRESCKGLEKILDKLDCIYKVVAIPGGMPDKWDIADAVDDPEISTEEIHNLIANAPFPGDGLVVVPALDFIRIVLPPVEPILGNVIRRQHLGMIYATTGVGKTLAALGMAFAIADGGRFLKWECINPKRVLYIDGEMAGAEFQDRLRNYVNSRYFGLRRHPLNFNLVTPDIQNAAMPDLGTPDGRELIDKAIRRHRSEVVFLDNLTALARIPDNDDKAWQPVQDYLLDLRRRGITAILIHHAGKSGQQRGLSKRETFLNLNIQLKRPEDYDQSEGCRFELSFDKARGDFGDDFEAMECRLHNDPADGIYWSHVPLVDPKKEKREEDRQAAAEGYRMLLAGKTQKEVREGTGISSGTISRMALKIKKEAEKQAGPTRADIDG